MYWVHLYSSSQFSEVLQRLIIYSWTRHRWVEGMGRVRHSRCPCVLLTRGTIPLPGSFHCYHKAKQRNTIGNVERWICVNSHVRQMYMWVRGEQSVYTPSGLSPVKTAVDEMSIPAGLTAKTVSGIRQYHHSLPVARLFRKLGYAWGSI